MTTIYIGVFYIKHVEIWILYSVLNYYICKRLTQDRIFFSLIYLYLLSVWLYNLRARGQLMSFSCLGTWPHKLSPSSYMYITVQIRVIMTTWAHGTARQSTAYISFMNNVLSRNKYHPLPPLEEKKKNPWCRQTNQSTAGCRVCIISIFRFLHTPNHTQLLRVFCQWSECKENI